MSQATSQNTLLYSSCLFATHTYMFIFLSLSRYLADKQSYVENSKALLALKYQAHFRLIFQRELLLTYVHVNKKCTTRSLSEQGHGLRAPGVHEKKYFD